MNLLYIVFYILFAVGGSTLLKYGSIAKSLFIVPIVNMSVSLMTFIGFIAYGISFLLYIVLLSKFDLSFISPITTGTVYMLLMFTAFIFFKEPMTLNKITGSLLIFIGILLMIIKK